MYKAELSTRQNLLKGAAALAVIAITLAVFSISIEFKKIDPDADRKGISPFGNEGVTATITRSNS